MFGLDFDFRGTEQNAVHKLFCQLACFGVRSVQFRRIEFQCPQNDAVKNAEAIMAVDGVVGCFIGPNDLMLSMGLTAKETGPGTSHEEAIMSVLEACKKTGKAAGKHCFSSAEVSQRIAQGFQFLALVSDGALMEGAEGAE